MLMVGRGSKGLKGRVWKRLVLSLLLFEALSALNCDICSIHSKTETRIKRLWCLTYTHHVKAKESAFCPGCCTCRAERIQIPASHPTLFIMLTVPLPFPPPRLFTWDLRSQDLVEVWNWKVIARGRNGCSVGMTP